LKLAIIAGEVSGDLLGADLVSSLRDSTDGRIELLGVGGEALESHGLRSIFDFSELSVMGFTQVIIRIPNLVKRIRQAASSIVDARPDALIIIDSPDFTHRVARHVRNALPDLPIINYVCPSVWAWKEYRARRMLGYIDHVLAVLPFEPGVMAKLGGPPTTYVGHRLVTDENLLEARRQRTLSKEQAIGGKRTILLLPGSRSAEITRLLPIFELTVDELSRRNNQVRYLLPTVPPCEQLVRSLTANWKIQPQIVVGQEAKWKAFADGDAAVAASGTVILELALAGVPVVSTYSTDWVVKIIHKRIKAWTAALPNLIADYIVVPEQINEMLRPGILARWLERLSAETLQRKAMIEGFDLVWERMQTPRPPGEQAAAIVLDVIAKKDRMIGAPTTS
jgi:lipid-A-disaccharide synthase